MRTKNLLQEKQLVLLWSGSIYFYGCHPFVFQFAFFLLSPHPKKRSVLFMKLPNVHLLGQSSTVVLLITILGRRRELKTEISFIVCSAVNSTFLYIAEKKLAANHSGECRGGVLGGCLCL